MLCVIAGLLAFPSWWLRECLAPTTMLEKLPAQVKMVRLEKIGFLLKPRTKLIHNGTNESCKNRIERNISIITMTKILG